MVSSLLELILVLDELIFTRLNAPRVTKTENRKYHVETPRFRGGICSLSFSQFSLTSSNWPNPLGFQMKGESFLMRL